MDGKSGGRSGWGKTLGRGSKILGWIIGGLVVLLLLLFVASFFIDEPLRRRMEAGINRSLDGYSVRLGAVDFQPIGLSITVSDLVVRQQAHPQPPVALFPRIDASIHWRELLTGNLVADWRLERPQLYVNLQQLRAEEKDETPVEERGWQQAVQEIYPLKINRLTIEDGELTYIDEDPDRPLRLTAVNLTAGNIRNIRSPENAYPSPFHLEADIFGEGHGVVDGQADFLAQPHPAIAARIDLQKVPLDRFRPITARANVHLTGGRLSGTGEVEFAPKVKTARLNDLAVDGLRVDYVHSAVTAEAEQRRARKAKEKAAEAKESEWGLQIDNLSLGGDFAFVNRAEEPNYRISLSGVDLRLQNLSNRFRAGPAKARLTGSFMNSGAVLADAAFRPEENGADFDLRLRIEGTRMTEMNDLLRAHTGMDVVTGSFSLYSEVSVRGRQIDGYVKPFFKDLDIYHPEQEEGQGLLGKIKEGVAGALSELLENPRDEVATQFDLTGEVEDPEASTWQIILELIRNGFFEGIIPGFRGQAGD